MRPLSRLFNRMTIAALAVILLLAFIIGSTLVGRNSAEAQAPAVYCVNGASFTAPIAPGSFVILGGANLATTTIATVTPNLTQLGGTTVSLTDASGATFMASLIYVSPTQINFMIPDQVALGTLNFTVTNGNGVAQNGSVQIIKTAPALFTFNESGQGVPLGATTYDGVTYTPLANPDASPAPVDPGYPTRANVLALFGTGIRYATNVTVRIGNTDYPAVYSGVDGSSRPGFDQVNVLLKGSIPNGLTNIAITADGQVSQATQVTFSVPVGGGPALLSLNDVQTVINQCVQRAKQLNIPGTCAVVDREGNTLGVFQMTGANPMTRITANKPAGGLEGVMVPASAAAISKAGTSAFFSTQGSAISTRTASFIIQEHFPPGVPFMEGGPLFGVQFSQLPCSDIRPPGQTLPLGLSGDPGSYSLYRNNIALGGIGFEGDGIYSISGLDPTIQPPEEIIATAAGFGFDTPQALRIDNVRVNGITLPYSNAPQTGSAAPAVTAADGTYLLPPRAAPPSRYIQTIVGGIPAKIDARFYPPKASAMAGGLTVNDVLTLLGQALQQANRERAAIRVGGNQSAQINATVIDTTGTVLGIASTRDAPEFGFDVSGQKARTANLFSSPNVVQLLTAFDNTLPSTAAPFTPVTLFVNAALALGVPLNGTIAYSTRGIGFLDRPFFPDGVDTAPNGPFSIPIVNFSPFNDGIQLALVTPDLVNVLNGTPSTPCVAGIPGIGNGIQPFAGGVVLYKNGIRVGAIGISGDGIDQDDLTAATGSQGFQAPSNINSSNVIINTPGGAVRLPYVRFPANPNL